MSTRLKRTALGIAVAVSVMLGAGVAGAAAATRPAGEIPVLQPIYFPGLPFVLHTDQKRLTKPAGGIYVFPDGKPDGKGTVESPLDLATVFAGKGPVKPGDVVWLMPGTYVGEFDSVLAGTAEAPILVRGWPGKRVRIDGTLKVMGHHTWYWGFEVFPGNIDHHKSAFVTGARDGVDFTHGFRCRLINVVVHNALNSGIGYHNNDKEERSETYGCIIYDNGWPEPLAHGWYIQGKCGEKFVADCISFNSWGYLIQVYASGSWVNGVRLEGNILFNPSMGVYEPTPPRMKAPVTFGGVHYPAQGFTVIRQNYTHFNEHAGVNSAIFDMRLGYSEEINDTLVCTDNFMVGGYGFEMGKWHSALVERNTFYLRAARAPGSAADKWKPPAGPGNEVHVLATARPAEPMFAFRPNKYELGRAHLAVYNFPRADAVTVDLADLKGLPKEGRTIPTAWLKKDDRYEVRSVLRYWGKPVAAGVFDGTPITVDMKSLDNVPIGGNGRPLAQDRPEFDAFVVLKNEWCMGDAP